MKCIFGGFNISINKKGKKWSHFGGGFYAGGGLYLNDRDLDSSIIIAFTLLVGLRIRTHRRHCGLVETVAHRP